MAELNIDPDTLYKALSTRIGELETENISLRLLLSKAGDEIDALEKRPEVVADGPAGAMGPFLHGSELSR